MTSVNEIKTAIESLPQIEFTRLMRWIHEKDEEQWDAQIAKDSEDGSLIF